MFEHLKEFGKILVTGPQRSGTNICAKMIAHDTGYLFVPEIDLKIDDMDKLIQLFRRDIKFVLHGPAYCHLVHQFSGSDTFIVLMRRDLEDIVASQERIDWCCAQQEIDKYDQYPVSREIVNTIMLERGSIDPNQTAAEVKYRFWDLYQKGWIRNYLEMQYNDLVRHPLWIPSEERKGFTAHQTRVEEVVEYEGGNRNE